MSASDFLRLPLGVKILVAVMFWPAIWAAALMAIALAGDLIRPGVLVRDRAKAALMAIAAFRSRT